MDLVVNEWLPEYFTPAASAEEKILLQIFLQRFIEKGDRIIVKEPSPFISKVLRYAKDFQKLHEVVTPIRDFIKIILEDSNRCVRVSDDEIKELPEAVTGKLNVGNYGSDTYLFEAASCIDEEKIIVTTDVRLKVQFEEDNWCRLELLADFLESY